VQLSDLNNFCIVARLTKDAVKKTFPSGTSYATFDVANNTGFGDHAKVNYFKCLLTGKRADSMSQYLVKGKMIAVSGVLETNNWTDNSGKTVKDWQLVVDQIFLMGGGDKKSDATLFDDDELKRQATERAKNPWGKNAEDAEVVF
jgi:single-strand DNA-binding protein